MRRRHLVALAALLLVLLALVARSPDAAAQTPAMTTLRVNADTYVSCASSQCASNFSTATTVQTQAQLKRALLKFYWPPSIPAGYQVTGVTLRLFAKTTASAAKQDAYAITNPDTYNTATVTWNTQPTINPAKLGSSAAGPVTGQWLDVPLAVSAIPSASGDGEIGILVGNQSSTSTSFEAIEQNGSANQAQLVVTSAPPPTTTTAAPTTTSSTTTSTTVAPTTSSSMTTSSSTSTTTSSSTTVAPTTTIPTGPSCTTYEPPLVITAGGTYADRCIESTTAGTPAIKVSTTAPVVLERLNVRHRGRGLDEGNLAGTNITLRNSKLTATNPGTIGTVDQRAMDIDSPASLVVEHNLLTDGMGIFAGGTDDRAKPTPGTFRITDNDAVNLVRYGRPSCCQQFAQFGQMHVMALIAGNRVHNLRGQSDMEDTVNLYQSGGLSDTQRIVVDDNLSDGAWALSTSASATANYTGGGFLVGDGGGDFMTLSGNRVVNTGNYGLSIAGGQHNRMTGNRVVSDGLDQNGQPANSSFAVAANNYCYVGNVGCGGGPVDNDSTGNVLGLERGTSATSLTRSDEWMPACSSTDSGRDLTGTSSCANTPFSPSNITAAHEQAEIDAWNTAHPTVGPDW